MFGLVSGLINAARGKLSDGYKNQLQAIGRESRAALSGVLTGDQGLFLHHRIKLDDPTEVKQFKDELEHLWMMLPDRPEDWAGHLHKMDRQLQGTGLSVRRTAFGIVAALVKTENLALAVVDYPNEQEMIAHVASVIRENRASLQKLLGDDHHVYWRRLRASTNVQLRAASLGASRDR